MPRCLESPPTLADRAKSLPLYPLPHHAISRLVHRITRSRAAWIRRPLTRWFIRRYGVDMSEAMTPEPDAYPDFNSFFTRALRTDARPMPASLNAVCAPADGTLSALGGIEDDRLIQAKGRHYSLTQLLGGVPDRSAPFRGGDFATIYLSPSDYHRVHMPVDGALREMVHVPGRLFSVARHTVRTIPGLFARNERVACLFDTAHGPMAMVLVGAINVASIETVWAGEITPPRGRRVRGWTYRADEVRLQRGAEIGRFNLGSTVILVFPRRVIDWDTRLMADAPIRVRQALAWTRDGTGAPRAPS
ncbi:archaetidylserine decarboxylase [Aquisalimonas sp.]|uniref:archaetidylserine decarboxylase n=1 Tax=Aquisalimonas sp. TaxID=1872621 RepID=UPI0025BD4A38|nr:archaetidylserine decarboxylase [Aquisalimonas sp.]